MRRITHRILIAALTFMTGVGGVMLWSPPPPFSLCDLSRDITIHEGKVVRVYEGRIVRVRGELSLSAWGDVHLLGSGERVPGSGERECGESAFVIFREEPKLIEEIRELNATWMYRGGSAKADVVLSGRFESPQSSCPNDSFIISDAVLESSTPKY